jgi:organic hydroperoxide reductase OsmC/OhrA
LSKEHRYEATVVWTGNSGGGTTSYSAYSRDHELRISGKPSIACSSDPAFRGDPSKHNPEEFLVAALSACHMLWYLHLCAVAGVVVSEYIDNAFGKMQLQPDGSGMFTQVVLRPQVTISSGLPETAKELHMEAHRMCFISNSVNFSVEVEPELKMH